MPDANTLVSMSRQVLISRRAEDAEELVKALEEKFYKPLIKPALEICIATVSPGLSQAIKAAQILALPSASAARFLNQLESVTCDHIYVQGRRTALAFEGKQTVQISDGLYAEDLAQCIHGDQPTAWVTILQGDLARPNLQAELERLGHRVTTLTVYENRCPPNLQFDPIPLHAAIYHSPSAVERQLVANPWLCDVPSIAIGRTTAAALRSGDCKQIIQAKGPDVELLIAELGKL